MSSSRLNASFLFIQANDTDDCTTVTTSLLVLESRHIGEGYKTFVTTFTHTHMYIFVPWSFSQS